ncbi:hypothetical protein QWY86_05075 [Pedobacter aquatilis]|uniref:hypothetical protein n=1 Tax=Pedobacter aquatilis TaxID=351343 RepID=UPI0025B3FFD7|nr:hypothetical protein [Pedobacter aquatilis]MDN3586028.1 hypothetical protein [Pedobacter aquatilis]
MNAFIPIVFFSYLGFNYTSVDPLKGKDLFGSPKEIKEGWLGYLKSKTNVLKFSNVPMFIIDKPDGTHAKILGIPKNPNLWASKFIGKTTVEKVAISKTLIQGIHTHSMGEAVFKVFAIVQRSDKSNLANPKGKSIQAKFPYKVSVYQNEGLKWNPILERVINNIEAYQKLQYEIAINY